MSVLIKGMEMPTSCWDCYFQDCGNCRLNAHKVVDKCILEDCIDEDCPLVPVQTPHGRLIDADCDANNYVTVWDCNCSDYGRQTVMAVDDLRYLPTIIEAEEKV